MADLENELRRALRDPPPDQYARERALRRLRSQMDEPGTRSSEIRGRSRTRILATGLALAIVATGFVVITSLRQPAVADEIHDLTQANLAATPSSGPSEIRVEQWGHHSDALLGGATFNLYVLSLIELKVDKDSISGTGTVLSTDFASEADRAAWVSRGEPPIPEAGEVDRVPNRAAYDVASIPSDPQELLTALEDGSITGYLPNPGQLFETIGSLLIDPRLSDEQRVALYQVVGSVEGVELLGDIEDPLNRTGVGFSCQVGPVRQVLIFDRATGEPIAFEEYSPVDPEQLDQWQAFNP